VKQQSQVHFLKNIQQTTSSNIAFVDEIADLLGISNDSAYRRLRGETSLTFNELGLLCRHYKVSFDSFNSAPDMQIVPFRYKKLLRSKENFVEYLKELCSEMNRVRQSRSSDKHIIYAGQGLPIFHYFKFPMLTAFKTFYWFKSIMNVDELQNEVFTPEMIDDEIIELSNTLFKYYLEVPSTEIWVDSTVMGTINQIRFYWDSGMFANMNDALAVCADVRALIEYISKTCVTGKKQDDFDKPTIFGERLSLYFSEIEIEKVSVLVRLGGISRIYLDQMTCGSIHTEHHAYAEETADWLDSIISKSNLISGVSQTMRYQFFNRGIKQLEKLEEHIRLS
jgi:transcriptional regulator with XRE-family HTH domain